MSVCQEHWHILCVFRAPSIKLIRSPFGRHFVYLSNLLKLRHISNWSNFLPFFWAGIHHWAALKMSLTVSGSTGKTTKVSSTTTTSSISSTKTVVSKKKLQEVVSEFPFALDRFQFLANLFSFPWIQRFLYGCKCNGIINAIHSWPNLFIPY